MRDTSSWRFVWPCPAITVWLVIYRNWALEEKFTRNRNIKAFRVCRLAIVNLEACRHCLSFAAQRFGEARQRAAALRILLQRLTECVLCDLQLSILERQATQRLRYRPRIRRRLSIA